MYYPQSIHSYPEARSGSEADIIEAARARAEYWKCSSDGPWVVTVQVGKRQIEVSKSKGMTPQIVRRR